MSMILQATDYKLYSHNRTVSGMSAKTRRTALYYNAAVLNEDGSVLEVRGAWDVSKLFRWLESFGFDVSIDREVTA